MKDVVKGLFKLSSLEVFSRQSLGSFTRKMALASSVALLLGGFAAQKSFAAQFFTPEAEDILRAEIKTSLKDMPVALIALADFQDVLNRAKTMQEDNKKFQVEAEEGQEEQAEFQKTIASVERDIILYYTAKGLVGLEKDGTLDQRVILALQQSAYDKIMTVAGEEVSSPVCFIFSRDPLHKGSLVAVQNPAHLFEPTDFDATFFSKALGIEGLDQALGEEQTKANRALTVAHELAHSGDSDLYESGVLKEALRQESYADVTALKALYKATGNLAFVKNLYYFRSAMAVLRGDLRHATQFDIARFLKQIDPSSASLPTMSPEQTLKALDKVWTSEERYEMFMEKESTPSRWRSVLQHKIAQGELMGDARIVAQEALNAMTYFDVKVEAAQKSALTQPNLQWPKPSVVQTEGSSLGL